MSPAFSLNKDDLKKIGSGAIVAMAGALLTYLGATVVPQLASEYPNLALLVSALVAVGLNALRKYVTDTRPTVAAAGKALAKAREPSVPVKPARRKRRS